jgi:RNA polymerase sigma factor (sigma-70 family)
MKTAKLKKMVEEARKEGALYLSQLDESLLDEETFDKNINYLIKHLDKIPVKPDLTEEPEPKKKRTRKSASRSRKSQDQLLGYIQEVNSYKRMNREDEVRYAKRMEFFRNRLLSVIDHLSMSPKEKEQLMRFAECPGDILGVKAFPLCKELAKCPNGKTGYLQVCCSTYNGLRAEFVERNLHIVLSLTQQYRTYGLPIMDLIQEGNAALIRAVEKFDWRKGVRFQTYATLWIRQAVERLITANNSIVRVPNYLQQKMRRFKREGIISTEKDKVSVGDLSDAFSVSPEVAEHLLETGRGHVSLDAPSSQDENNSLGDMLSTEDEKAMPKEEFRSLKDRLKEALSALTQQERFILNHRFGLEGKETKTLEEIGKLMSVSRERIRQLQIRALQKLKRPSFQDKLIPFLS